MKGAGIWITRTTCEDSRGNTARLFPDASLTGKHKCPEQSKSMSDECTREDVCMPDARELAGERVCSENMREMKGSYGHCVHCLPLIDEQKENMSLA